MIQEAAKYNEAIDEWQLKYIAFTGNNIQKVRHFSLFFLSISFLSSFSQSHFSLPFLNLISLAVLSFSFVSLGTTGIESK